MMPETRDLLRLIALFAVVGAGFLLTEQLAGRYFPWYVGMAILMGFAFAAHTLYRRRWPQSWPAGSMLMETRVQLTLGAILGIIIAVVAFMAEPIGVDR